MASPTIKMLWGLAKSPELSMTDEELHLLVSAHTGKDSIRALNKRELGTGLSTLFQTNFFRLFFRYCTGV